MLKSVAVPSLVIHTHRILLRAGADVNWRDKQDRSALHHACRYSNPGPGLVELLLEAGADKEQLAP